MFDKKNSTRIILKNLGLGILAVGVTILAVFFMSREITKLSGSLVEKKAAAISLSKRSEEVAALRSQLAQVGDNASRLGSALPPDDNISGFLSTLDTLAQQDSLAQTVKVGTATPTSISRDGITLSQVDYSITLNGTIITLIKYLKDFEALPYFSAITSISINAPLGWDGNSSIIMQAQLYTKQGAL